MVFVVCQKENFSGSTVRNIIACEHTILFCKFTSTSDTDQFRKMNRVIKDNIDRGRNVN